VVLFEKIAYRRDSNRLPGVFITGESIMNTNNSKKIRKIRIIFGRAYLKQEKLLREKPDENYRDTVSLRKLSTVSLK
jgi:hypothetical protein